MNLAVEELLSALTADSIPAALRFLLSTAAPDKAIASIRENIQFESLCQSGYLLLILSIILSGVSDKRGRGVHRIFERGRRGVGAKRRL